MTHPRLPLAGLALALFAAPAAAESRVLYPVFPAAAAERFNEEAALAKLVAAIDRQLDEFWARNGIKPSEPATDAEFLRRVSLDLVGRVPQVAEVRAFLADPRPDKRARKVDELIVRPGYATHFATVLRREWVPQAEESQDFRVVQVGGQFENWVFDRLRTNTRYDEVVREMLTAPTLFSNAREVGTFEGTPMAFNQINEFKPENVAAAASRLFMGVKLECAQCHDHPFAPYKREQFWQLAAFFAEVQPAVANVSDVEFKRQIKIPDTTRAVSARYFDGKAPEWRGDESPRQTFVRWLTSLDNPYFARNAANRAWAYFFGVGFIDPVDEPGEHNEPTVPEVLDELTKAFAASGYDSRFLARALPRTRAYQLSSRLTDPSQAEPRAFARMNVKGLSAEQLYDSLSAATGYQTTGSNRTRRPNPFARDSRSDFLTRFASNEKRTERQTSILQALTLMNGKFVNDQTSLDRSETLAAIADFPFPNTEARVEALFLAALCRQPTPAEAQKFASYVERGGAGGDRKKALADVFWALLNSSEFILNH